MENNTIMNDKELYNALYKTLVNLNRSDVDANTILSELKEKDGKELNRVLQTAIQNESNDDTKQKLNQLNKSLIEVLSMNLDNSQENKSLVSAFIKDAKVIADMLQMDYVGESSDPIRNDKSKKKSDIQRKPEPALVTTSEGYTIQEAFFLNRKNGNKRLLVPLMKLQAATKELVKKIDEKVATQKDIKRYLSISLFGNQEKQCLEIAKVIDILKDMTSEDGQNEFSDVYDTTQMNQLQDLANRLQKFNKECHDVAKTKGAIDLGNLSKSGKAVVQSLDQVKTFVSEINTNALQSKQKAKEEKEKDKKLPFFNKVDKAVTKFTGEDTPTAKASDIVKNDNPTVGIQIKESFEDDFDEEEIFQEEFKHKNALVGTVFGMLAGFGVGAAQKLAIGDKNILPYHPDNKKKGGKRFLISDLVQVFCMVNIASTGFKEGHKKDKMKYIEEDICEDLIEIYKLFMSRSEKTFENSCKKLNQKLKKLVKDIDFALSNKKKVYSQEIISVSENLKSISNDLIKYFSNKNRDAKDIRDLLAQFINSSEKYISLISKLYNINIDKSNINEIKSEMIKEYAMYDEISEDELDIIQEGLFTTSKNVYNRMCYDLDVCLPYIKDIADKIVSGEITSPKQLKKAYCREIKVSNTIGDDLNGNISTYQTTEYGEKTLESYIGDLITHLKIAAKRLRTKKAFTEEERERVLKLFESVVQMRKDTIKCINGKTLFSEYNPNGIKNLGKLMNEVYTEGTSIRNYYAEKIGENPSKKDKKYKSKQNTTPSTETPVETVETSEEGTKDAE